MALPLVALPNTGSRSDRRRAQQCSDETHGSPHAPLGPENAPLGWVLGRAAAAATAIISTPSPQKKTLLLGPLGHAPLDRRRRQVELVVQRLLHQIQERPLDGAEDHLLEVCVS